MLTAILLGLAGGVAWWVVRRRRAARADFTREQVRRIEEIERGRDRQRAYYTRDV